MKSNLEISEEQAILFFHRLKRELHCNSTQRVVSLMRIIVSKLGLRYTTQQLNRLVSGTPAFIHLLFTVNNDGRRADEHVVTHLDELADVLFQEARLNNVALFRTEIEALSTAAIVLTSIQKLFKKIGLEPFSYSLRRELALAVQ